MTVSTTQIWVFGILGFMLRRDTAEIRTRLDSIENLLKSVE